MGPFPTALYLGSRHLGDVIWEALLGNDVIWGTLLGHDVIWGTLFEEKLFGETLFGETSFWGRYIRERDLEMTSFETRDLGRPKRRSPAIHRTPFL